MPHLLTRIALLWCAFSLVAFAQTEQPAEQTGTLQRWHPITLTFRGPAAMERGEPNPFRDYRLTVTFRHGGTGEAVVVPGYFAADGDAAETSATAGDRWRVHFVPGEVGRWTWAASFREGEDVALSGDAAAGTPAAFDGAEGAFTVDETDKSGRDFRSKGMLRYVGERYLRFDNGEYFLKGGADSPETLLAYADFDGTYDHGGGNSIKRYHPHLRDWRLGDPTWQDGKGRGLIGLLNYLAAEGMNAFSFLPMNVDGDGKNVWPWTSHIERDRYDVSKLAQWEIVFSHADRLGLHLHFKTQETENDQLLDGGELGPERRLYYRELVARFGHHHALNWNLGEENDLWDELDDPDQTHVKAHAQYLRDLDPYGHPIVIHSYPNQQAEVYEPLLGEASAVTGASVQTMIGDVHRDTKRWVEASAAAGKPWVVANDEQGNASTGVKPDGPGNNHMETRRALWGNLTAGGAGVEYYFGYQFAHNDLNAEDLASRAQVWAFTRVALEFFRDHLPFVEMASADDLTPADDDYVFARPGTDYVVYLPAGGTAELDLSDAEGTFAVHWFDPRWGGPLQTGTVETVDAGASAALGAPPAAPDADWVVLVQRAEE